jgi:hypothetical protein
MVKTGVVKKDPKVLSLKNFAKEITIDDKPKSTQKVSDIIYDDLVFNGGKNKIAFLFLTIDNLKKGEIWYNFFKKNKSKATIYSHIKKPKLVNQGFLIKSDISEKVDTEWGDISLVIATNNLLREAYKDPDNEYFILLSDSTIPLYSLDEIYSKIINMGTSAINYFLPKTPENKRRKDSVVGLKFVRFYRQPQWMILKREHVKFILDNDYTENFVNGRVPDENYYINIFKKFYKNFDDENTNLITTHVDWSIIGLHPKIFDTVNVKDFTDDQENSFLFLRKVNEKTIVLNHPCL